MLARERGDRCCRVVDREEVVHLAALQRVAEAPDADGRHQDDELDQRGREVHGDRWRRLREEERARRSLEDKEERESHAQGEAPLAAACHEDRDDGVHDRKDIGHRGDVR